MRGVTVVCTVPVRELREKKMATSKRFASFDDEEFNDLITSKDAENTKKSTKQAVGVFREYLREKSLPGDFETLDKQTLAKILGKFYVEARKTNGDYYKTATLNAIRAGLNRHLKSEYQDLIDIIKDSEFVKANEAFKAATVELKKIGKGDVKHHEIITDNDLQKLYESAVFDQNLPSGLQDKVWFELMLFICRRGRENLRELKKDHFVIERDENGRQYVTQAVDELTKKSREDCTASRADAGRMYETGNQNCPVSSFQKYLSKLNPDCEFLFQTPKPSAPTTEGSPWFKKCPIGKNTLGTAMVRLSKSAGLSKIYTNHCLRATCISILDREGFENRDICQISGHANESSLASYTGRVTDSKKQQMSDALVRAIGIGQKPTPESILHDIAGPSTSRSSPEPGDLGEEVNFDLDLEMDWFDSQVSEVSVSNEETVHNELVANVIEQESDSETRSDNSSIRVGLVTNRSRSTRTTTRSTTTTRKTSQTMTSPFVFNNCNVTINYFNSAS